MLKVVPNSKLRTGSSGGDNLPGDDEVLDALVSNNGIIMRVALKLEIDEADIYRIIARNAKKLSTRLRAATMVQSYATLVKVTAALEATLLDMQPDSIGRTYGANLAAFSQLAGQFDEQDEQDTDDDTSAAKQIMLDNIAKIRDREQANAVDDTQKEVG